MGREGFHWRIFFATLLYVVQVCSYMKKGSVGKGRGWIRSWGGADVSDHDCNDQQVLWERREVWEAQRLEEKGMSEGDIVLLGVYLDCLFFLFVEHVILLLILFCC